MIALIITIIVMLILVAVTVRTVVNSGLFKHAGDAVNTHSMQEAREKLGTTLSGAMAEKYTNKDYNENDYLDGYIKDNLPDSKIAGDIVIIDGWAFELDRTVPEIKQNLGKEGDYTFPKILSVTANISDNKETATLTIEAEETENGIEKIEVFLDGKKVDEKACGGSKTKVTVTTDPLTENGKYTIKVYSKLMATEIKEITELVSVTSLEVTSSNSSDNTYATITVKAKEAKKGIQRIEITKEDGSSVAIDNCNGNKELITKNYRVEENGTYTITVYAENNATETVTITGLTALTTNRTGLKVGDYIAYNPDTAGNYMGLGTSTSEKAGSSSNPAAGIPQDTTLKWRVMNINDDGSVNLVSAAPIATNVYFQGSIGYNNGVLLLNDLCKTQYSNSTLGVTARSIDLEDIEKKFNSTGINARNAYSSNRQYGNSQTYSGNYSYSPYIYDRVGKTAAEESKDYYSTPTSATHSQKGTLEVQQTYYYLSYTPASYFDDSTFHELIFGTGTAYWLASRYADCRDPFANFGLRYVYSANLAGNDLFYSSNRPNSRDCRVRPVVSLGSNIKISIDGGTADSPRIISL